MLGAPLTGTADHPGAEAMPDVPGPREGLELRKPGAWAHGEVMIPAAGRYWLWSRSDDCEMARPYVIEIAGERYHVSAEATGERRRAWTWHRVTESVLPRGPVPITIRKPSEGAYVWLDCLLLTNDRGYVPTGVEQRLWLANQERLVPVDLRRGYPGRPAPSHRLAPIPSAKPPGPADYRRTLFIYPYRGHYLVELDGHFWGRKRYLVPFFDLPRVPWRLAEIVVYPPPDTMFESVQAQIEAATTRPVVNVRHGALALRGDFGLAEGGKLVLRSGESEAQGVSRRQERITRVRARRTTSGCEVDCAWGTLHFDVYGRLCSARLHAQRRA